jgi:hypothetical protein
MAQQLSFLSGVALRGPLTTSQWEKHAALKYWAPPSSTRRATTSASAPAQESLFEFHTAGHEVLMLPTRTVLPSPRKSPSSPAAVESAGTFQHVRITFRGDKTKACDILDVIRTLQAVEQSKRPATTDERQALARFPGFGVEALSLVPDPVTGPYKDAGWRKLGPGHG